VVTEWGIAKLRGRSLSERAHALIGVAHPDHREALEREAHESGVLRDRRGTIPTHRPSGGRTSRRPPARECPAPAGQPVDVALRDGSTVRVRPVRAGDLDGLRELLAGMSDDSRWLRFLSAGVNLDKAAHSAADSDDGAGLVVTAGSPERIVAHAMYVKETPERAEVAFEVADAWHGRGIATILLAHLAGEATRTGVTTFVAYIHPTNRRMIGVFRQSGFPVEVRSGAGEIHVEMPAALGEAARLRFEDRGRAAAAAAVEHVLRPASVALVTTGGTATGATVLRNLRAAGYGGELRIVVADLEDPQPQPAVELALLAVPPATVLDHARACGEAGVRAIVVLTGGFLGSGDEGRDRLRELLAICRRSGMRLVGPSSLGVMNTDPRVRLNATSVAVTPPAGPIALASQSGAIGVAAITEAARRGFGLSSFVATGDKADLSGNDFLQYWEGMTPPASCCSTSSRSATRGASPRSRAGWPARSRSWPSRAAGSPPAKERSAPGSPRCSAHPTSPSMPCSSTPASSAPRRCPSSSTWPRCSPRSRCRAATAWASSATPAGRLSRARTHVRPPGFARKPPWISEPAPRRAPTPRPSSAWRETPTRSSWCSCPPSRRARTTSSPASTRSRGRSPARAPRCSGRSWRRARQSWRRWAAAAAFPSTAAPWKPPGCSPTSRVTRAGACAPSKTRGARPSRPGRGRGRHRRGARAR
jgi:L-amino acid N-acyltransferase YncA